MAARVLAAVKIAIGQNRWPETFAPARFILKRRCPLTRIILKSTYLNYRSYVRWLSQRQNAFTSVGRLIPDNCSGFRPDRNKKASHSVKRRHLDGLWPAMASGLAAALLCRVLPPHRRG